MEALRNGAEPMEKMRQSYHERRDFFVGRLNEMGIDCHLPGGAFYVFPDVRKFGLSSQDFAMGLLKSQDVAAVPGDAFGESGQGFLRCCYATAFDQLREAADRMEKHVGTLG